VSPSAGAQLIGLSLESFRDAVRRRVAIALAILSVISLLVVDSCTSCGSGTIQMNGIDVDAARFLSMTGVVLYAVLALWVIAIAGALASDHLQQALEDGTAHLTLARPVGRGVFALARLAGALAVSLGTGALLLGGAALFLHFRYDLALLPALAGAAAAAVSALAIASLAMSASLYLPRFATLVLVFLAVVCIAAANGFALTGAELGPIWGALDRFGPPIGTGIALAAAEWVGRELPSNPSPLLVALRLGLWAAFGPALLTFLFRRREI
jgi:ABC-type transport system involved in multi-copper enzyme maturation permease subunit